MTWVKICGLTRQVDVEHAVELGADAVGFVFESSSPRCVGEADWHPDWIEKLRAELVAVYGPAPAVYPSKLFRTIQAYDWSRAGVLDGRAKQLVARVGPTESADRILRYLTGVQRLVLDSFDRNLHGGTGKPIDWDLAAEVVAKSGVPVVLAGGLTPENVAEAIRKVKPFGVDVSSGIEISPGVKDHDKVRAFIDEARAAL